VPVVVTTTSTTVVPELAVAVTPHTRPTGAHRIGAQRAAGWSALLVELTGSRDRWDELLDSAATEAQAAGAPLDVRIVTADPTEVLGILSDHRVRRAARVAVFDPLTHVTTPPLWRALTEAAATAGYPGLLIAGARSHFTELNRQHDRLPTGVPLTFSVTPQMHATEVAHLVDSLAGQVLVARNATRLAGGHPVHIGPVTLHQRFNAVATTPDAAPPPPDPLLPTPFGAAWTLGSLAALTQPGVQSVTFHALRGGGGIYDEDGVPTPVGRLLEALAGLSGRPVLPAVTPPGVVAYPVLDSQRAVRLFLANLTSRTQLVRPFVIATQDTGPAAAPVIRLAPWTTEALTVSSNPP
jgi:hypothetical protein